MTLADAIKAMPKGGRIRRSLWNEVESIDPFVDFYHWDESDNRATDWHVASESVESRVKDCSPQTIGFLF